MRTRILGLLFVAIVLLLVSCSQQTASTNPLEPDLFAAPVDTDFLIEVKPNYEVVVAQGRSKTIVLTVQVLKGYTGTSTLSLSLEAPSPDIPVPPGLSISPSSVKMVAGQTRTYTLTVSATNNTPFLFNRYVNLKATAKDGRAESVFFVLDVVRFGFSQIDSSHEHTCAISTDRKAYCWGDGSNGRLGNGGYTGSNVPVEVQMPPGISFYSVSAGAYHTCAIGGYTVDNTKAYCWGLGTAGRLGTGNDTWSLVPVAVKMPEGIKFVTIDASTFVTCATTTDANPKAYCWGDGQFGQLGNGTNGISRSPVAVKTPQGSVYQITVGGTHSCAIVFEPGGLKAYCWGEGDRWQLGNGGSSSTNLPTPISLPGWVVASDIGQLTAGLYYSCARFAFSYSCWGNGSNGQLGNGANLGSIVPTPVSSPGTSAGWIFAGFRHTCARQNDGLYCWGDDSFGQLGRGPSNTTSSNLPVRVAQQDSSQVASVTIGESHTCGFWIVGGDFKAYCWGRNHKGQLGIGSYSNSNVPVEVVLPQ